MRMSVLAGVLLSLDLLPFIDAQAVQLSSQNLDQVINGAQVVFVAFCADWCPFSRRLKPIFEESAIKFKEQHPRASATWAIVDSVQQADVADKYFVNKYPTMKIFVNGELVTKEYRSTRSVEALTEFVLQQLSTAMSEFTSDEQLKANIDSSKRNVIARFANADSAGLVNLKKVASILREECSFFVSFHSSFPEDSILFRDPHSDEEQKYTGDINNYDFLKQWLTDKCIPLVREVTFENVEELTEEGLPFLIFFRDPARKDLDKMFTEHVIRELPDQKASVNALLADGFKFAHPLRHLGKSKVDLPVLAIDSFQHMFLFPNMDELAVPGKLRQFIMDLHSGKLHKEFHENLDQKMIDLSKWQDANGGPPDASNDGKAGPPGAKPHGHGSSPPPSIFKELKPSEKRYSLLMKTEL